MAIGRSGVSYLSHTWNPVVGCTRGCEGCWLPAILRRIGKNIGCDLCVENVPHVHPGRFDDLTPRQKPKRIGLGFFTDLFGDWRWMHAGHYAGGKCGLTTAAITRLICRRIRDCPQHRFITPTQQPQNIPADLDPPDNWWLLVTVRNQDEADERIPLALASPFKHVGVSYEPALGPVDFMDWLDAPKRRGAWPDYECQLEWVIAGHMSGPKRIIIPLQCFRDVRDQCVAARVPFYMKQISIMGKVRHNPTEWPEDLRVRQYPPELVLPGEST